MANIIQWNIRGIEANRQDLDILVLTQNPSIICLQETLLNSDLSYKFFQTYNALGNLDEYGRGHGGTSILVKNDVIQSEIQLDTKLQAVAVRVTLFKAITVCSVYIPPSSSIEIADLNNLLSQLPPPYILLGDFNAHSYLWGNKKMIQRVTLLNVS